MPIFLGDPLPGGEWSLCPHGEMRHPMLSAAIEVDNHAHVSALAGWPDTYSAGVVQCLIALRLERAEHHAEMARRAQGG